MRDKYQKNTNLGGQIMKTDSKSSFGKMLQKTALEGNVEETISLLRPILIGKYGALYHKRYKHAIGMEVEDIVSIMEVKVWESISSYDASKASFYTYISNILEHLFVDLQKKASNKGNQMMANASSITSEYCKDDQWVSFHETIGKYDLDLYKVELELFINLGLTPKERTVVTLRQKGYETSKIANIMGLSEGRVSQLLSSARKKWLNA